MIERKKERGGEVEGEKERIQMKDVSEQESNEKRSKRLLRFRYWKTNLFCRFLFIKFYESVLKTIPSLKSKERSAKEKKAKDCQCLPSLAFILPILTNFLLPSLPSLSSPMSYLLPLPSLKTKLTFLSLTTSQLKTFPNLLKINSKSSLLVTGFNLHTNRIFSGGLTSAKGKSPTISKVNAAEFFSDCLFLSFSSSSSSGFEEVGEGREASRRELAS